jgi:CheY-like chemotaxis protein
VETTGVISSVQEVPRTSGGAATVLVVEDEAALRQAVAKLLHKKGFLVLEAANGNSAIDLVRANRDKIDVILLDATIPGASSAEIVAEAARGQPAVKVILTSAYSHLRSSDRNRSASIRCICSKAVTCRPAPSSSMWQRCGSFIRS